MLESGSEFGRQDAPKQWHPVLVDGLRVILGNRLRIEPEHAVAALPTRIDVLVLTPASGEGLEPPYDRLAQATLVELESPGEWATWRSLHKLYVDGTLYSLDQDVADMTRIGLWLVTSRLSSEVLRFAESEVGPLKEVGPGLWEGSFIGSPVLLVHLHELPLSLPVLPLLMVYQGPREAAIAEFALAHGVQYPFFVEQAVTFHPRAVEEVLRMKGMNVEAYRKLANVKDIVHLFGPRILIEEMGPRAVIEEMGSRAVIEEIGPEEVVRTLGEDRLREILDRMARDKEQPETAGGA